MVEENRQQTKNKLSRHVWIVTNNTGETKQSERVAGADSFLEWVV